MIIEKLKEKKDEKNMASGAMKTNDYTIRLEKKEDYRKVENLVRESFWNVYRPGCSEHFVIHVLRDDPAFVKELDFVMEQNGKLIGQNMFMRTVIEADDGRVIDILTMGPIGITPEFKRKGYGKKLLDYCLEMQQPWASARCYLRAASAFTASAALPMPVSLASAIMICRKARTTPSSSAKS